MSEHDEGFAAGIEAAAKLCEDHAGRYSDPAGARAVAARNLAVGIRRLKPAPQSAEQEAISEYVTVPREPTRNMLNARHRCDLDASPRDLWKAMLAAAPRSAEHTAKPSAQERERFEAYWEREAKHLGRSFMGVAWAAWQARATAPSPHKLDEMIELQRNTCDCVNDDYFRGLINGMILAKSIIEGGDEDPKFVSKPDARNVKEPAVSAFESLKAALKADPSYAWSWHCNLAMPIMDSIHCSSDDANKAGADLMRYLFDIDIRTHENWHHDPVGTPDARSTSDAAVVLPEDVHLPAADGEINGFSVWNLGSVSAYAMSHTEAVLAADRVTRSTDSSAEAAKLDWCDFDDAATATAIRGLGVRNFTLKQVTQLQKDMAEAYKLTTDSSAEAAEQERVALAHFTDYFVRNYPGPNTIISRPEWHAPKVFREALYALKVAKLTTAPHTADETRVDGGA